MWHDIYESLGTWLTDMSGDAFIYVTWRDSFICVTCDMTHSYVWHDMKFWWLTYFNSQIRVTWHSRCIRDVTHWYVAGLIHMCDVTCLTAYVGHMRDMWRDSSIWHWRCIRDVTHWFWTSLRHMCDMWRDSFICVAWCKALTIDLTHKYGRHDTHESFGTWLAHLWRDSGICVTCDVTHSYVWCDMPHWYVTWLTNIGDMTLTIHSGRDSLTRDVTQTYVWHVTWLVHVCDVTWLPDI